MKLTISIEYSDDPDLPDITVEQVKKALQKFIVPSRYLHIYQAVEHRVQRTASWVCPICGYRNNINHDDCHSCGTRRR